jgi:uncharacterized protein with von Willebrand factor type A (vWA) domain
VLRGVDRAAFAVPLAARLRAAGLAVDLTAVGDLVRALRLGPPMDRRELYWMTRITLVRKHSEIAAFDAVFAAVFADAVLPMDPNARRNPLPPAALPAENASASLPRAGTGPEEGAGLPWATLPTVTGPADAAGDALTVPLRLPSDLAGLPDVPFDELAESQLALLGRWLTAVACRRPVRRSRRMATDRSGHRIALRATISRSRHTGFDPVRLVTASPRWRQRPVVMLCDVSQSMQAHATPYLHLMRALALGWDAEVFAFATRLTRLTGSLTHRAPVDAIAAATTAVTDRFGGTRIAGNLELLLAGRHGGLLRGAIVLIGSDGWDSDPPERLARAMARLYRRAHRVVWMNPRAGAPGFQPRVATMAAALPYCDSFLPADTFAALVAVIEALGASGGVGSR